MTDESVRAAIVGLGWWGRHIVGRLANSETIRLVCAVDVDPDAAAGFATSHGLALLDTLEAALAREDVEAVILATPHARHEAQALAVAGAGKHLFCEKPLTLTASGAARVIEACKAAGVVLGIGHERRFEPALAEIGRLARGGALGTVMHAEANFSHDKLAGLAPDNWRMTRADAPAAGMTGMGIHLTDAFIHLFGPVETVHALATRRALESESGDVVSVLLRFRSGLSAYLNAILKTPHYCRFTVFGETMWAEARNHAHPDTPAPTTLTLCRSGEPPTARDYAWTDTVRANLEAFAEAVRGRAAYPYATEEILHNIEVFEAVVRACETGAPVRPG